MENKVHRGEPITAKAWNGLVDSVAASSGPVETVPAAGGGKGRVCWLRNNGNDLAALAPVGLASEMNTSLSHEQLRKTILAGQCLLERGDSSETFAVTLEPINRGQVGRVLFCGSLVPLELNLGSETYPYLKDNRGDTVKVNSGAEARLVTRYRYGSTVWAWCTQLGSGTEKVSIIKDIYCQGGFICFRTTNIEVSGVETSNAGGIEELIIL